MAAKKNKTKKKKVQNRQMRRTVMGTLSVVFMLSAIIVALIPTPKSKAAGEINVDIRPAQADEKFIVFNETIIPDNYKTMPVYATGDNLFRIAVNNFDKSGTVVYYNKDNRPDGGRVVLSDVTPLYLPYNRHNEIYMLAVSARDYPLYYASSAPEKDSSGKITEEDQNKPYEYTLCTYENAGEWSGKPLYTISDSTYTEDVPNFDGYTSAVVSGNELPEEFVKTSAVQLKTESVKYIASERCLSSSVSYPTSEGWGRKTAYTSADYEAPGEESGVFFGATNISDFRLPDGIIAIGNYAFRGCSIGSITFGTGIQQIGEAAFENCARLSGVNFSSTASNLTEIRDYAFRGCSSLGTITIPSAVNKIGSFVFEECTSLVQADMSQMDSASIQMGHGVFYNCSSLVEALIPAKVENLNQIRYLCFGCKNLHKLKLPEKSGASGSPAVLDFTNVRGCYGLKIVECDSQYLKFDCPGLPADKYVDLSTYSFPDIVTQTDHLCAFGPENLSYNAPQADSFKIKDFYIIAPQQSYAYTYSQTHGLACQYEDLNGEIVYEKTLDNYAFCVNQDGVLEYVSPKARDASRLTDLTIPDYIAGMKITSLPADTFSGNQALKFIFIPNTVTSIAGAAFEDCPNVRTVYFEDSLNITSIGADAFKIGARTSSVSGNSADDQLRFIGSLEQENAAFDYAMTPANTFNASDCPARNIVYCSTFPTNLQIGLENGEAKLIRIPQYDDLTSVNGYSLNTYNGTDNESILTQREENMIAATALEENEKLHNGQIAEVSENTQKVLDAVRKINVPAFVTQLGQNVFRGNKSLNTVNLLGGVSEIPAEEFKDCTNMEVFQMSATPDGNEIVGDKAFEDCKALNVVSLPSSLAQMGDLPFAGCTSLQDVRFNGSEKFSCPDEKGIIYQENGDGTKTIIECLESRGLKDGVGSSGLRADEFENVSAIRPKAFYNCSGIQVANLEKSTIKTIPESCFENAVNLYSVSFPRSLREIQKNAFKNTKISFLDFPVGTVSIDNTAFTDKNGEFLDTMSVACPHNEEDPYAVENMVWDFFYGRAELEEKDPDKCKVTFYYSDNDGKIQTPITKSVLVGGKMTEIPAELAEAIKDIDKIVGWDPWPLYDIREDITVYEVRSDDTTHGAIEGYHWITFVDEDGYEWDGYPVKEGTLPKQTDVVPFKKGYVFTRWYPSNYYEIPMTAPMTVLAKFIKDPNATEDDPQEPALEYTVTFVDSDGKKVLDTQTVPYGQCPKATTVVPTRDGYTFATWSPSNYTEIPLRADLTVTAIYQKNPSQDNDVITGDSGSDTAGGSSGSSSGNKKPSKPDDSNTTNPDGTTATPDNKPGSSTSTVRPSAAGSGTSVSGNTVYRRPSGGKETIVEVPKTGISNKGLVSATVTGSNDNFIVKITDSDEARILVEQALLTEYGSLDDLKYFAMDISLYDSTGTSKIAVTNGITVTITMPIPDVMAGYAGNNKAMAVKNGLMEKLNARLLTIDNVPCISFDATHFSPYAIYVETNNLTQNVSDAAPKTGDPIHPKWFLAIGLALMSIIMFLGKGSKNKIVKVMQ